MEIKEIKFIKDKLAMNATVSELMMNDIKLITGRNGDDFMRDTFTMQLQGFIMSNLNERKTITVYRERPTFWEWLTRKPRSFTFEFTAKEVLKNPPQLPPGQSVMMYAINETQERGRKYLSFSFTERTYGKPNFNANSIA